MRVLILNQKDSCENITGNLFMAILMSDAKEGEGPRVLSGEDAVRRGEFAFHFKANGGNIKTPPETLVDCIRSVHRILGPEVPIHFSGDFFK